MDLFTENVDGGDGEFDDCRKGEGGANGYSGGHFKEEHQNGGQEGTRADAGETDTSRDEEANQDFSHESRKFRSSVPAILTRINPARLWKLVMF